ncbi:MAG TPA: glycosyltransferase family 2 protein, partial [Candidatus Nanoarchaeia archaeon]|nr:glycosyltransferase family 2 protein [Candidatus Nanoarchaeia archaeon]
GSLKRLISHFADKRVSVVCARPVNVNHAGMFGFFGDMLYDIVHKQRLSGAAHLSTNLCAFRNGAVKSIPLEALVDDYVIGVLAQKSGRFVYEPGAVVYAKFPSNASDFIKQRVRTFAGYMQVKEWFGDSSRSFASEAKGVSSVLFYIKSPKHLFWIVILVLLRVFAWAKAFITYRFLKKDLKTVWAPAESTKR